VDRPSGLIKYFADAEKVSFPGFFRLLFLVLIDCTGSDKRNGKWMKWNGKWKPCPLLRRCFQSSFPKMKITGQLYTLQALARGISTHPGAFALRRESPPMRKGSWVRKLSPFLDSDLSPKHRIDRLSALLWNELLLLFDVTTQKSSLPKVSVGQSSKSMQSSQ